MKKHFFAAAIIGMMVTLCGCSDSDGDINSGSAGGQEAIEAVNPLRSFPEGLPQAYNGNRITTDSKGRVVSIGSATFTYMDQPTNDMAQASRSAESYDVLAKVKGHDSYICLNERGLVKTMVTYEYGYEEVYSFDYDATGHITHVAFQDKEDGYTENINVNWENGNVKSFSGGNNEGISGTQNFEYYNSQYPNGIENKNRLYDIIADTYDSETLNYLYYTGMLGISNNLLPVKQTFKNAYANYSYTFYGDGTIRSISGFGVDIDGESFSFTDDYSW